MVTLKLDRRKKNLPSKSFTLDFNCRISRAVYFPPYEGAYFVSEGDKYYLSPKPVLTSSNSPIISYNKSDWELEND